MSVTEWDIRPEDCPLGMGTDALFRTSRIAGKPNQIRKGDGPDGVPDEWDNYDYKDDKFYKRLCARANGEPKAKYLFLVCRLLENQFDWLPRRSRFAARRVPNAYAWLKQCEACPLLNGTFDKIANAIAETFEKANQRICLPAVC
jgi:hypothetical protein